MSEEIDFAMKRLKSSVMRDGCNAYLALLGTSAKSPDVFGYIDELLAMLNDKNSFIRTRALGLICANAKWDDGRIFRDLDTLLCHITDEKPITSRQFIKELPKLAYNMPKAKDKIIEALSEADFSVYAESMRPLVEKDAAEALEKIEAGEGEEKICDGDCGEAGDLCKRFGVSF